MALPVRFRDSVQAPAADKAPAAGKEPAVDEQPAAPPSSGGSVVVTINVGERCLLLYPLREWEVVQRKLEALPNIEENTRRLQRLLIGHATDIDVDSQGRILLPAMLRDYGGLGKKLVLVGQGNKIEVWDADHWQERMTAWMAKDSGLKTDSEAFTGLLV